jgi:hypothetical protein
MDLADYGDALTYESERQLTTEPLKMDVLIIRKARDVAASKNIAAIFRGRNIVEYKSPGDYVSVAGFYKVYGYACLYAYLEKVEMKDISVSFMETRHPQKLLEHLREERGEARGVTIGKHEDARNALRGGFPMDAIQRITGLDMDTIRSLR